MEQEPIAGVTETVPTYRSLLVHYDPCETDFDTLCGQLGELARTVRPQASTPRRWRIPVTYGGENGADLEEVAKTLRMTPDEVIEEILLVQCMSQVLARTDEIQHSSKCRLLRGRPEMADVSLPV